MNMKESLHRLAQDEMTLPEELEFARMCLRRDWPQKDWPADLAEKAREFWRTKIAYIEHVLAGEAA